MATGNAGTKHSPSHRKEVDLVTLLVHILQCPFQHRLRHLDPEGKGRWSAGGRGATRERRHALTYGTLAPRPPRAWHDSATPAALPYTPGHAAPRVPTPSHPLLQGIEYVKGFATPTSVSSTGTRRIRFTSVMFNSAAVGGGALQSHSSEFVLR